MAMTNMKKTEWKAECNDVPFRGLLFQSNFTTEENMINDLQENTNDNILFVSSNDGVTPTSFQSYNLEETIKIRNYLDSLIAIAQEAISLKH